MGKILKKRRKELKLSRKEVAKEAGVLQEHIRDIENEKRCASVKVLEKILKALKLNTNRLLIKVK